MRRGNFRSLSCSARRRPPPQFAADTPATTPADLAEVFALGFGPANLLQNTYRLSYLQDAQANPDGGWPAVTTGVAAATPGHAVAAGAQDK